MKQKDHIRHRLTIGDVPTPPADLLHKIKSDIPPTFQSGRRGTGKRIEPTDSVWGFWGLSWQLAAAVLVVVAITAVMFKAVESSMISSEKQADEAANADRALVGTPEAAKRAATGIAGSDTSEADKIQATEAAAPAKPAQPVAVADASLAKKHDEQFLFSPEPSSNAPAEKEAVGSLEEGAAGNVAASAPAAAAPAPAPAAPAFAAERQPAAEPRDARRTAAATAVPAPQAAGGLATAQSAEEAKGREDDAKDTGYVAATDGIEPPVPLSEIRSKVPGVRAKAEKHAVIVEAEIDATGVVRSARVVQSVDPDFDRAAVKAVIDTRFKPATRDGAPVAVRYRIEVR